MALVALVAVASSAAAGTRATPARVAATISIPGFPALVATGYGSVWVAGHRNGALYRINPGTNHVTGKLSLPGPISGAITIGGGGVWVQSSPASGGAFAMYRINPSTMWITTRHEGVAMAIAAGSWWFSSFDQHAVLRVKPATGHVAARIVKLGVDNKGINPVTGAAFGSVWVYSSRQRIRSDQHRDQSRHGCCAPPGSQVVCSDHQWIPLRRIYRLHR